MNVKDILIGKINEIQGRLPLKLNGFQDTVPFNDVLSNVQKNNADNKASDSYASSLEAAQASLANSKAIIPKDKSKQMEVINDSIQKASIKYGIDSNLIKSVIKQESDYNPYSMSNTGAQGLMQIMPETADALKINDPWDIAQNIDGGTRFLKDQLSTFNNDLSLSLAAYNAGPNSVITYKGIPPYTETQNYVAKVLQYYKQYSSNKIND